jgi:adenylate kinase
VGFAVDVKDAVVAVTDEIMGTIAEGGTVGVGVGTVVNVEDKGLGVAENVGVGKFVFEEAKRRYVA